MSKSDKDNIINVNCDKTSDNFKQNNKSTTNMSLFANMNLKNDVPNIKNDYTNNSLENKTDKYDKVLNDNNLNEDLKESKQEIPSYNDNLSNNKTCDEDNNIS